MIEQRAMSIPPVESIPKKPKEGTKFAIVLDAINAGRPRAEIAGEMGGFERLNSTIGALRTQGYLPKPTQEERARVYRESRSAIALYTKILGVITPYASMGMSAAEIKEALVIKGDHQFSHGQIEGALSKGRRKDILPKLNEEEKQDVRKDRARGIGKLKVRVKKWLAIKRKLEQSNLPLLQGRLEWKKAIGNSNQEVRGIETEGGIGGFDRRRRKEKIVIENQSRVWLHISNFYMWGALAIEISWLTTNFTEKQIQAAFNRNTSRSDFGKVEPLNPLNRSERIKKAIALRRFKKVGLPEVLNKEIIFTQRLIDNALIPDRLTANQVMALFKNNGREFPDNFFERVRIGVFFKALKELKESGNDSLLRAYYKLGQDVDFKWFTASMKGEEGFIKAKLLTDWADGEDEKGFYELKDGIKVRHMEIVDDKFVNGNSILVIEKLGVINGRNGNGNLRSRTIQ